MPQTSKQPGAFRVEVVRDTAGLHRVSDAWAALDRRYPPESPYHTKEFLEPWLAYSARSRHMHTLLVWNGQRLVGLMPLVQDTPRVGPFRITRLALPTQGRVVPRMDARIYESQAPDVVRTVFTHLRGEGSRWTVLALRHLTANSVLLRLLPDICREFGLTLITEPSREEGYLYLGLDWDAYLARLPQRHRRTVRQVLRQVDDTPGWEFEDLWPTPPMMPELLTDYRAVLQRSWKSEEAGDEAYAQFLGWAMAAFATGRRLYVSRLRGPDGSGAAAIMFRHGRVLTGYNMAFAQDCPIRSPGTALLAHIIAVAHRDGYGVFDFSTSAPHVDRWMPVYNNTVNAYVVRRTPAGLAARAALPRGGRE